MAYVDQGAAVADAIKRQQATRVSLAQIFGGKSPRKSRQSIKQSDVDAAVNAALAAAARAIRREGKETPGWNAAMSQAAALVESFKVGDAS